MTDTHSSPFTSPSRFRIREGLAPNRESRRRTRFIAISLADIQELASMENLGFPDVAADLALAMTFITTKMLPPNWKLEGETVTYTLGRDLVPNRLGAKVYLLTVHTETVDADPEA
jgi:ABC-type antimicrobial peptide transport system permease subunit